MTDILYNLQDLKEALKNDIVFIDESFNFAITSVVFDNREVRGQSLFVARKGETNDGHNFIKNTLENTEAVILVQYLPENVEQNSRIILVKDTMEAFKNLAIFSRNRLKGNVIGITGSVGKTSTKDMLFKCFSAIGKSFCNQRSFNSYNGVLTTLTNTPKDTEFAIYEMGTGEIGEMEVLKELVRPEIAIILNILSSHIANFGTEENIATEKSNIFNKDTKCLVLNKDNKLFDFIKNIADQKGVANIKTFSKDSISNVKLNSYKLENDRANIEYIVDGAKYNCQMNNLDYNIAFNFLAVLSVASYLKVDINKIIESASDYDTTRGRNNIEYIDREINGKQVHLALINGSYNAVNPETFISGLRLMNSIFDKNKHNKKVCIWGDMRETGDKTEEFHLSLKQPLLDSKVDLLLTVGENMKLLNESLGNEIKKVHFENIDDMITGYKDYLEDRDFVFVKSSNGTRTYKLVDDLVSGK